MCIQPVPICFSYVRLKKGWWSPWSRNFRFCVWKLLSVVDMTGRYFQVQTFQMKTTDLLLISAQVLILHLCVITNLSANDERMVQSSELIHGFNEITIDEHGVGKRAIINFASIRDGSGDVPSEWTEPWVSRTSFLPFSWNANIYNCHWYYHQLSHFHFRYHLHHSYYDYHCHDYYPYYDSDN